MCVRVCARGPVCGTRYGIQCKIYMYKCIENDAVAAFESLRLNRVLVMNLWWLNVKRRVCVRFSVYDRGRKKTQRKV